jgi:hypothetical protein
VASREVAYLRWKQHPEVTPCRPLASGAGTHMRGGAVIAGPFHWRDVPGGAKPHESYALVVGLNRRLGWRTLARSIP